MSWMYRGCSSSGSASWPRGPMTPRPTVQASTASLTSQLPVRATCSGPAGPSGDQVTVARRRPRCPLCAWQPATTHDRSPQISPSGSDLNITRSASRPGCMVPATSLRPKTSAARGVQRLADCLHAAALGSKGHDLSQQVVRARPGAAGAKSMLCLTTSPT